jgi:hypothetical protein
LDYYFGWLGSWVEGYAKCVARLAGMLLLFFFSGVASPVE